MVSNASDDLPEPDRPVITISLSRGRSRSMFLRLCVRAPRMLMNSIAIEGPAKGEGSPVRRTTGERIEWGKWGQTVETEEGVPRQLPQAAEPTTIPLLSAPRRVRQRPK